MLLLRRTFLGSLTLLVVGCGPRWVVVRQASPNPLLGARRFAVDRVHFEGLRVGGKSEAEYLAGKDEGQRASFEEDKRAFEGTFAAALTAGAQGISLVQPPAEAETFVVRPAVGWFEPGFYAGVAARDTEVELVTQIVRASGEVVDEFTVRSRIPATLTSPSSGDRLRKAGDDLGGVVAKYLRTRTAGG
jgi:hypothetical protein